MKLKSLLLMSLFIQLSVCEALSVHVGRYFGSAEGSKFVEMASVDNVKRTWVNYGVAREWSDSTQGQVGGEGCGCNMCMRVHVMSFASYLNVSCSIMLLFWRLCILTLLIFSW